MNASAILQHLLAAVRHAQHSCERTQRIVSVALARFEMRLAMERAAR
jgi:hypothetical protein